MNDSPVPARRINLLIAVTSLYIGGAEVVVKNLVQAFNRRRFNITVCCIKARGTIGDELKRHGVEIITLSCSNTTKVDYFTFKKLLKVIRNKRIDIIHTHSTDALADAVVCKFFMPKLKLVHTFHFGNYPHITKRLMWMEFVFSRFVNRLVAVGEVQRRQLMSFYHLNKERIVRVLNGVPTFSHMCDSSKFRERIGAGERIVVGTIATMTKQKGLPDLMMVASHFKKYGDKVCFVIVGEGPVKPQLIRMRSELGLDDIVIFLGWVKNAAAVALPAFDIFFLPSLWEAMSIAILEAMVARKPIVATCVGENPYLIDDGVNGLLVKPGEIDKMALLIEKLIDNLDFRKRLGAEAARKACMCYTVRNMTSKYEQLYMNLMKDRIAK